MRKTLKRWLPTALIVIGLCGMFHVTASVPAFCDYSNHSVGIWPWEQCYEAPYDYPAGPEYPAGWVYHVPGHQYPTWDRLPILGSMSPRQSEILILLGVVLLALRKLPDRRGEPVTQ